MITISKLLNGLTIATDSMRDVESVSINLLVKVGSCYETLELNGLSHFLEHMAFKGTKNRTAYQIAEAFDYIGGDFNAYTSREYTVYTSKVLKDNIDVAIGIIADIIQNSLFDQQEIDKELGVILQEIASYNDAPDEIIYDIFQEIAYPNQAIGRSILGTENTISKFKTETFKKYISQYYQAENMILSIAGNITHESVMKLSEEHFLNLSNNKVDTKNKIKYAGGKNLVFKDLEQLQFILGYEGFSYKDENYIASQLLAILLGGGMSSRLFQEVREKRGLAYSIYSYNNSFSEGGTFCIYAGTSPSQINELYDVVMNQLNQISNKITEDELVRAKNQFKSSILMGKESTYYRSADLAKNIVIHRKHISCEEMIEKIDRVDQNQISALMQKILLNSKPTIALYGNTKYAQTFD